ncbi:YncE family protein [Actinomadura logoneensis]|nr:PQQ-like beta-propeller repeat protein [Actinomadura logoneensis]
MTMPFAAGTVRDIPVRAFKLCGLTWTGQDLWFSEAVSNQIMALDPATGEVRHRVPCAGVRTDLTTLDGDLVQVAGPDRDLRVLDRHAGEVLGERPNPRPGHVLCGLEATRHGLWLGYEDLRQIDLRDPDDLRLLASYQVRRPVAGITMSDGFLVYSDYRGATINLLDLARGVEVASVSVAGNPTGIAWDGTRIWYCDYTTLQLRAIEIPGIAGG